MSDCPGSGLLAIRRGFGWYRCPTCGDAFRGRGEWTRRHVATGTMTKNETQTAGHEPAKE